MDIIQRSEEWNKKRILLTLAITVGLWIVTFGVIIGAVAFAARWVLDGC